MKTITLELTNHFTKHRRSYELRNPIFGRINVYQDSCFSEGDLSKAKATVNWCACGSLSVDDSKLFFVGMTICIFLAEQLEKGKTAYDAEVKTMIDTFTQRAGKGAAVVIDYRLDKIADA